MTFHLGSIPLLHGEDMEPADIMEKYGKAVVLIAGMVSGQEVSLGSGLIVKSDGIILTNYHVIEGSYPAIVKLKGGDICEDISIIDFNERLDIAVLKIKAFNLPTVVLGDSSDIRIGEKVFVIGNPHGYENTISDGLLSQIRDTGKGYFLHQISAPISAGSSGSPVFNKKGQVIGIATLSDIQGQNLNFSIPINYVKGLVNGQVRYSLKEFVNREKERTFLSETEKAKKLDIGVALKKFNTIIQSIYDAQELAFDGIADTKIPSGIYENNRSIDTKIFWSNRALKSSYNDLVNINVPDNTIQELKNTLQAAISRAIEGSNELIKALERTSINAYGEKIAYPDWARGQAALIDIGRGLGLMDSSFKISFIETIKKENPKLEQSLLPIFLDEYKYKDATLGEIEQELQKSLSYGRLGVDFKISTRSAEVWFVRPGSPAEQAKIQRGDIILGIVNGPDILTQMDYEAFQKTTKHGDPCTLKIMRSGAILLVPITLQ